MRIPSQEFFRTHRRTAFGMLAAATLTASGAGAATLHRFASGPSSSTSEGAVGYNNTSASGSALQGTVSTSGGNSTIKIPFGVLGEYQASTSTFGIGLAGISTSGYAIGAEAFGANPAVLAENAGSGDGEDIITANAADTLALLSSGGGYGLHLTSTNSGISQFSAVEFDISDSSNSGLGIEVDAGPNLFEGGTFFSNGGGDAIGGRDDTSFANAQLGNPTGEALVATGGSNTSSNHPDVLINDNAQVGDIIDANTGGATNFELQSTTANRSGVAANNGTDMQISGDLFVYGRIFQDCLHFPATSGTDCEDVESGSEETSITPTVAGGKVRTYGARQSQPTVEDFGNAQLVSGNAYVHLDPAFANTISRNKPYYVFVTPHGNSNGMFVSNIGPNGFSVGENNHGRSTLAFDYRIVAAPLGAPAARFAAVVPKHRMTIAKNPSLVAAQAKREARYRSILAKQRAAHRTAHRKLPSLLAQNPLR